MCFNADVITLIQQMDNLAKKYFIISRHTNIFLDTSHIIKMSKGYKPLKQLKTYTDVFITPMKMNIGSIGHQHNNMLK